jgi:Ecdysteroid kinase-like family
MADIGIPAAIEDISPEWLTAALRAGGERATVATIEHEPVGLGIGIMSMLFRLVPTYSDGNGPGSVIVKLAPPYEAVRQVARGYRLYEREVNIYNELGGAIGMRPPRCYFGAHDVESDAFVLVLEDLAGARMIDQLDGCSADDARTIVAELARHHAAWWQNPKLVDLAYIQSPADPPYPQFQDQSVKQAWPVILERFGDSIPERVRAVGDRWSTIGPPLMEDAPNHPNTLLHGDVRLDNLFFHDDGGEPVSAVDWQLAFRGVGATDLAYFTSQSLTVDVRREHESDLCHLYHDTLAEGGVTDYPYDELWTDYRRNVLFCLTYPLTGGAVELVNDRAYALATAMIERSVAAIEDLDADELAPDA